MKIPNIDRLVMRMAGSMLIFASLMIFFHSVYWIALTGFVGLNLLQASFTGFCPIANVFLWLGAAPGAAFEFGDRDIKNQPIDGNESKEDKVVPMNANDADV